MWNGLQTNEKIRTNEVDKEGHKFWEHHWKYGNNSIPGHTMDLQIRFEKTLLSTHEEVPPSPIAEAFLKGILFF